jgi:hypothetical protein
MDVAGAYWVTPDATLLVTVSCEEAATATRIMVMVMGGSTGPGRETQQDVSTRPQRRGADADDTRSHGPAAARLPLLPVPCHTTFLLFQVLLLYRPWVAAMRLRTNYA